MLLIATVVAVVAVRTVIAVVDVLAIRAVVAVVVAASYIFNFEMSFFSKGQWISFECSRVREYSRELPRLLLITITYAGAREQDFFRVFK